MHKEEGVIYNAKLFEELFGVNSIKHITVKGEEKEKDEVVDR